MCNSYVWTRKCLFKRFGNLFFFFFAFFLLVRRYTKYIQWIPLDTFIRQRWNDKALYTVGWVLGRKKNMRDCDETEMEWTKCHIIHVWPDVWMLFGIFSIGIHSVKWKFASKQFQSIFKIFIKPNSFCRKKIQRNSFINPICFSIKFQLNSNCVPFELWDIFKNLTVEILRDFRTWDIPIQIKEFARNGLFHVWVFFFFWQRAQCTYRQQPKYFWQIWFMHTNDFYAISYFVFSLCNYGNTKSVLLLHEYTTKNWFKSNVLNIRNRKY